MADRWYIITGEYPPQEGGVSDYTHLVARGLAAAGEDVVVWCPPYPGSGPADSNILVQRLPDRFGRRSMDLMRRLVLARPGQGRLLVQYLPHAFGWKAMNLRFCLWLGQIRAIPVWVMFHEVAFPFRHGQPWRHNALALVHRGMARLVSGAATRRFVSTTSWKSLLRPWAPPNAAFEWLPIPSPLPTEVGTAEAREVRERWAPGKRQLVGHFGTYNIAVIPLLSALLPPLLRAAESRFALLLGRGSLEYATSLVRQYPDLEGRLVALGSLSASAVAAHLSVCDLLIQPYIDGATTRRTTLMAGLALGRAVLTTIGPLTEPFWSTTGAVALAPVDRIDLALSEAESLLADPQRRERMGATAGRLYRQHFALEHLVRSLRSGIPSAAPASP